MHDPRAVYSQLLEERRAAIARCDWQHLMLGYAKVAAAAAGAAMLWAALFYHVFSPLWTLLPAAALLALAVWQDGLGRFLERGRRAERYFAKALARLDGKWAGTGEAGDRYLDPAHPYARDLDLFGSGSLFELLCTARTHIGVETLARWLLSPAGPPTVRARQQAVEELRPRVDLREDLAVAAEEARAGVDPIALAAWGEAPAVLESGWPRALACALSLLGLLALGAFLEYLAYRIGLAAISESTSILLRDFFLVEFLINALFLRSLRRQVNAVVAAVEESAHELSLLSDVLLRLERESFQAPLLAELRASLDSQGLPPSKQIARLSRLLELLDSRENLLLRVLEPFVLWTPHLAFAVEHWRRRSGAAVRRWLLATGEIEALGSLAGYAYEHPGDPFPEFVAQAPWLEAAAIGHPLIPEDRVVRNDVRVGGELAVLVVSGSNMSGKSTLLRTLGINAVLAQAGAPVRARKLRMSPLAVGASIRITDSLQGGVSRFYAEILRLRQILDQTGGPRPVLFLIDEFLHGTNSHDRRIGAEAVVHSLVKRGAIGLITTHDLALTGIAGALGERAANVHFEDQVEDGRIRFDYQLRPGVVQKSNAIELMRSVGLEI